MWDFSFQLHLRKKIKGCKIPIVCNTPELRTKLLNYFEINRIETRHYFAGNTLQHKAYKDYGDASDFQNAPHVLKDVFYMVLSIFK